MDYLGTNRKSAHTGTRGPHGLDLYTWASKYGVFTLVPSRGTALGYRFRASHVDTALSRIMLTCLQFDVPELFCASIRVRSLSSVFSNK